MNEAEAKSKTDSKSLLKKYNTFLVYVILSLAIFAPITGFALLSNRYVFLILVTALSILIFRLVKKGGPFAWSLTAIFVLIIWIYPTAFAFCINQWVTPLLLVAALPFGYLIKRLSNWKWGTLFGGAAFFGIMALFLFSTYLLTFPWQYERAIDDQRPVVSLIFDQRLHPAHKMIRNIHFDPTSKTLLLTRGPDRRNSGAALIIGKLKTGIWRFTGLGTSQAMAVDPNKQWVIIGEATEDRLTRFDLTSFEAEKSIPIHKVINCSLENKGNKLFCISENPHLFLKIDPDKLEIKERHLIKSIRGIYGMHVNYPDNAVFLGCEFRVSGNVVRYSLDPFKLEKSVNLGRSLVWDIIQNPVSKKVYVALPMLLGIPVLDPLTLDQVDSIPVSRGTRDLLVDPAGKILYASNFLKGYVTAIDLKSKKSIWQVYVGPRARGMTYDQNENILYVGSGLGVVAIDCAHAKFRHNQK